MTYIFRGLFAAAEQNVFEAAHERWPTCYARLIAHPFPGIGISCDRENYPSVKEDLIDFSKLFPAVEFVWIEAECFGGVCDYRGFVCRDGEIVDSEDWPPDPEASDKALLKLLSYLGLASSNFEPFHRGYFANT